MESKNVRVIGIDLGTTYSRVGFWIGEELRITRIPSCIAFTDYTEEHIVGDEAFDGVDKNPSNTILDVKRLIGAKFSDNNTQLDILRSSVEVIEDPISKNDELSVVVRSFNQLKRFSAEELLCMILKKLKQIAEQGLGLDNGDVIFKAVISVPSCYNNAQRLATKRAATMAGFEDSPLYCSDKFDEIQNDDCLLCARSKSRLRFACEDAKGILDSPHDKQTVVFVDSYYVLSASFTNRKKAIPLSVSVTKNKFAEECQELFDKCEEEVDQCVQISGILKFHEVILVGGSTRISRIRELLEIFCRDAQGFCEIMNPDTAVVQGAAIQAAMWSEEALSNPLLNGISITDVAALSLSAETLPNLIPRNTVIPTERTYPFTPARDVTRLCVSAREDNNLIGNFIFDGIQATEMGLPNITVSFAVDRDGILNVSASQAAEDGSRIRQLARQVINRSLTPEELNQFGRDMENPEQEEIKRMKLEARMKVSLFVHKHMSREVPDDFSVGFSASQGERLSAALADAETWLENNELPEVRASELKLDELQRTYFQILHERRGPD
ncbi:hypothetical protein MKW92_023859 [Papaver armeniacum]|nr:hypothetical protein MKW92_023859 [Papaver armeniacum]